MVHIGNPGLTGPMKGSDLLRRGPFSEALPVLHADLEMLVNVGGRERTTDEYATLLARGGLRLAQTIMACSTRAKARRSGRSLGATSGMTVARPGRTVRAQTRGTKRARRRPASVTRYRWRFGCRAIKPCSCRRRRSSPGRRTGRPHVLTQIAGGEALGQQAKDHQRPEEREHPRVKKTQGGRPLPLDEAGPVHLVHDHVADRTRVG